MKKAYCQDVCECIQKTIVRKWIDEKKKKKNQI